MTDQQFDAHIERLQFLRILAVLGSVAAIGVTVLRESAMSRLLFAVAFLFMAPLLVYLVILTIWHWKARYRGTHSDVWGAFLIIETSGLTKLVYLFRHLIPDARRTGRYKRPPDGRPA